MCIRPNSDPMGGHGYWKCTFFFPWEDLLWAQKTCAGNIRDLQVPAKETIHLENDLEEFANNYEVNGLVCKSQ